MIEPKPVGRAHPAGSGATNSYFLRLSSLAGLGWAAFFVLLALYLFTLWFHATKPPQIMVVDQRGNFLGYVNFENPLARTDAELIGTLKRFGQCYWSLNAATVKDDVACVLSMMDTMPQVVSGLSLREMHIESLKDSNFIAIVEAAGNKTTVQFFDAEIDILERLSVVGIEGEPYMLVRATLAGEIQALGTRKTVKTFRQEITLRLVPRTDFSLVGAKVHALKDI
ncbi:hypothetical protein [Ferrimonas balearica]|uniref:hypothetical protein n=1 Tax=Ferrimonas balearica TaxID=44012 RepID=UPI001C956E67|nr:hypothetical protein [Ferrimonas balearica]MBY5979217.1 hypothetical protein [Ferrimonas balearica]